jgi:hypothetical protein
LAGCFCHNPADSVVTTPRIANADESNPAPHVRSTVRSRKWVAQEMHGS